MHEPQRDGGRRRRRRGLARTHGVHPPRSVRPVEIERDGGSACRPGVQPSEIAPTGVPRHPDRRKPSPCPRRAAVVVPRTAAPLWLLVWLGFAAFKIASGRWPVELRGLEPLAFWMQTRRSSS